MTNNCCRVKFRIRDPDAAAFRIGDVDRVKMGVGDPVIRTGDYDIYDGPYEAVSAVRRDTVLNTRGMAMADDVTIHPIPIYEVSNPQGGKTVTIGNIE